MEICVICAKKNYCEKVSQISQILTDEAIAMSINKENLASVEICVIFAEMTIVLLLKNPKYTIRYCGM